MASRQGAREGEEDGWRRDAGGGRRPRAGSTSGGQARGRDGEEGTRWRRAEEGQDGGAGDATVADELQDEEERGGASWQRRAAGGGAPWEPRWRGRPGTAQDGEGEGREERVTGRERRGATERERPAGERSTEQPAWERVRRGGGGEVAQWGLGIEPGEEHRVEREQAGPGEEEDGDAGRVGREHAQVGESEGIRRGKENEKDPRDPIAKWKDLFAKNRKERRVAAKHRGVGKEKSQGRIRVCSRVCLAGLGPDWATLSRLKFYFSFAIKFGK